ncbi:MULTISPECIES: hypothetical protein [Synechococcus]|jgi:hypothetical protein|uniref:Uncharacterized protein n=1 Tax=Synechococcus lacustris str. Tous TaxID=1910958 RepID=A0A2P7EHR8_9SYNE|nr:MULTISPECIES: hypothetical protein [Synechococcus]MCF8135135.1 hypothetical protein [Synechococcus lacustris]NBV69497.1 hypothetical protein [Synechococcaceae bacterium WB4_2_0805]MCP9795326.1 hypothetical protein [Synechococcus lacustris L1F-Slac]MCP9811835.1 hypothetical protein [Synechococcus lacustris Maggiore-St4-Slac]MCP9814290.1 hypothetical protein [Synechococcus lacustris L1E-Slac]
MENTLGLSLGQKFEMERISRAIDSEADPTVLRGIAKQLLNAWQTQKAATSWVIKQQISSDSNI